MMRILAPGEEVARAVLARIGEQRQGHEKRLTEGQATDFADYRYHVGYLKGLADVAEIITAMIDEAHNRERGQ